MLVYIQAHASSERAHSHHFCCLLSSAARSPNDAASLSSASLRCSKLRSRSPLSTSLSLASAAAAATAVAPLSAPLFARPYADRIASTERVAGAASFPTDRELAAGVEGLLAAATLGAIGTTRGTEAGASTAARSMLLTARPLSPAVADVTAPSWRGGWLHPPRASRVSTAGAYLYDEWISSRIVCVIWWGVCVIYEPVGRSVGCTRLFHSLPYSPVSLGSLDHAHLNARSIFCRAVASIRWLPCDASLRRVMSLADSMRVVSGEGEEEEEENAAAAHSAAWAAASA
jgi:hypothetical protein